MNHAITIGGLLFFIGAIVGGLMFASGALAFFAGSMSDAPEAGESAGKTGCLFMVVGIMLTVGSVLGLIA